jgi:hypothetical protein
MVTPQTKVIIIDCCWYTGVHVLKKESQFIKDFVAHGGYLITTGWGSKVVQDVFPEYLQSYKCIEADGKGMCNMDIQCVCPQSALFVGCMPASRMLTCEGTRPLIPLSQDTHPLLFSQSLQSKARQNGIYAALGFSYERGRVLVFAGHLDFPQLAGEGIPIRQESLLSLAVALPVDLAGPREIGTAQLMALNFIIKALD